MSVLYKAKSSANRAARQVGLTAGQYEIYEEEGQFGFRELKVEPEPQLEAAPRVMLHKSTIDNPTRVVWDIAEEMKAVNPQVKRKEVIEECQRLGISYYTARTQYQQWMTAVKNSSRPV